MNNEENYKALIQRQVEELRVIRKNIDRLEQNTAFQGENALNEMIENIVIA